MKKKRVHFVGVGGIGMSALARYFLAQNWAVTGSDLASSEITKDLKKAKISVKIGHKAGNLPKYTELVVYSRAIPSSNSEIREARRRKVLVKSYPEALGELTRKLETIAVAGSHGKSTTTSLLALSMIRAGLDPTVIVGTKLWEFGNSNFYFGESDYLVVEADEYAGAFFHYSPAHAIVLNIDKEHLDFYKTFGEVKKAFLEFIANVRPGGVLVLNRDDEALRGLRKRIMAIAKKRELWLRWVSLGDFNAGRVRGALQLPGEHNVSNAFLAYEFLRELGVRASDILKAFSKYGGAWRRMEYRGKLRVESLKFKVKADVYDDYAHHPTEIRATLNAFKEKFPKKKLVCVFQPHQAKRLSLLFKDFVGAFCDADVLVLLPVYQVAGRDAKELRDGSERLAEEVARTQKNKKTEKPMVTYLGNTTNFRNNLLRILGGHSLPSSVLVMMGAGDIFELTSKLVQK